MNYLAHLVLAEAKQSQALGNLLGDFVKGSDLSAFPPETAAGIRLHRHIDAISDHHPASARARRRFPPDQRRYAGIALDLYWDFLLSRHWDDYALPSRPAWIQHTYEILRAERAGLSVPLPHFDRVLRAMVSQDLLGAYADLDKVRRVMDQIGRRLRKPTELRPLITSCERYHSDLEPCFHELFSHLLHAEA